MINVLKDDDNDSYAIPSNGVSLRDFKILNEILKLHEKNKSTKDKLCIIDLREFFSKKGYTIIDIAYLLEQSIRLNAQWLVKIISIYLSSKMGVYPIEETFMIESDLLPSEKSKLQREVKMFKLDY